jgi:hypothetical protein
VPENFQTVSLGTRVNKSPCKPWISFISCAQLALFFDFVGGDAFFAFSAYSQTLEAAYPITEASDQQSTTLIERWRSS